jgi:glycerophosphoryl diester phosphodiesterase
MSKAVLTAILCAATPAAVEAASETEWTGPAETVWTFSNADAPFAPDWGAGTIKRLAGPEAGSVKPASEWGLPPMADGDPMTLRMAYGEVGLLLRHGAGPNGVFAKGGRVSNYTVIFDALWEEKQNNRYRPLIQTIPLEGKDAELYVMKGEKAGIGTGGRYNGEIVGGRWARIALVFQTAIGRGGVGQIQKFIDGRFVGGHNTHSRGFYSRWSAGEEIMLLSDGSAKAPAVFVSGVRFIDRVLPAHSIEFLGGPSAKGPVYSGPKAAEPAKFSRRVEIVAHRGDNGAAPENTIAAIESAFRAGADHVEVDVRSTADGVAVLMHDATVDRTTDGTGKIRKMTLEQAKALDAGSWFDPRFAGETVPTLAEALRAAKGKGRLILDVKGWRMGAAIQKAIKEAGVEADAVRLWQGDNFKAIQEFRRSVRGAKMLWGAIPKDDDEFERLMRWGVVGFDLDLEAVTPAFLVEAKRRKLWVSAYTVLDPDQARKLAFMGVDAIETDYPGAMSRLNP